jgi:hypothetical protein
MRWLSRIGFLLLCWGWITTAQAQTVPPRFAVLDFEASGQVSEGIGQTLAMLLYNSLNAQRYILVEPHTIRGILEKHEWSKKRQLTEELRSDLKKLKVSFLITGSVGHHYGTFSATYRVISIEGRILHSDVLPPVQNWVTLINTLQYSMRMLLQRQQTAAAAAAVMGKLRPTTRPVMPPALSKLLRTVKKNVPMMASKLQPFKNLIKDTKKIPGLFPLYVKSNTFGQQIILMEIDPKQLEQLFLFSPTLEGATGDTLLTFTMLNEYAFFLRREENRLFLMEKNTRFRVSKTSALNKVLGRSFADSARAMTFVLSQPHPKRKTFLVDASKLFLQDLIGVAKYAKFFRIGAYRISKIRSFPKNLEMTIKGTFLSARRAKTTLDGQAMLLLRYSVSTLPDAGYRPRYADERVGHFLEVTKDFTSDHVDTRFVRYISRWRLEKKYPKAPLSEPKKPIVYWLENGIPKRYRAAVSKGIEMWNPAFARIGFKNAVIAKQQPDDAQWDAADVRYNSIRWFMADSAAFAQGPSRTNPLTGEIYDADIRVSSEMTMFLSQQFSLQIEPLQALQGTGLEFMLADNEFSGIKPFHRLLQEHQQTMKALQKKLKHANHRRHQQLCTHMDEMKMQAALGWGFLNLQGEILPQTKEAKRYIDDFIISVIAHEVGHTLGLRHNFKASTLHTLEQLHDAKRTTRMGLTGSVMEYSPVNLALPGQKQGQYWQTTLGPYDKWAIAYAYAPIPSAKTPEEELPLLNRLASLVARPELAYATDEDAFGLNSVDPTATQWDLGKEPLEFYKQRSKIAQAMWERIEKHVEKTKGAKFQRMRLMFNVAASTHLRAGLQAAKYIGGLYHHRDRVGDPKQRLPFVPVPAKKQRAALHYLAKEFFGSQSFNWSPTLLNKLAPERMRGFDYSIIMEPIEYPLHRTILALQLLPLYRVMYLATLSRVEDTQLRIAKGEDYLSISEIVQTISLAVWQEIEKTKTLQAEKAPSTLVEAPTSQPASQPRFLGLAAKAKPKKIHIPSTRRALQNNHVELLAAYSQANSLPIAEAPTAARLALRRLHQLTADAIPYAADIATKQHLENINARISQILNTVQIRIR